MIVIESTRPSAIFLPNSTKLVPGENDVSEKVWEACKEHKAVKQLLLIGILIDKGKGKAKPLIEQLYTQPVEKARKVVAAVDDLKLLRVWLENDKRVTMKKFITKRIEEVLVKGQKISDGRPKQSDID